MKNILKLLIIYGFFFTQIINGSERFDKEKNIKTTSFILSPKQDQVDLNILQKIKENYSLINKINKWSKIINKEIHESIEGGELNYYYENGILEKVVEKNFGEMWQDRTEYYFLNGEISFVFEKVYRYNRPFYYDQKAMKENSDNEYFDFIKSEITETRNCHFLK